MPSSHFLLVFLSPVRDFRIGISGVFFNVAALCEKSKCPGVFFFFSEAGKAAKRPAFLEKSRKKC